MKTTCAIAGFALVLTASPLAAAPIIIQGTGLTAAQVTPFRDTFRTAVGGGIVPGANGSFGNVRREINWDGVPDASSAPNLLANNFFSARGVIFSTPGSGVEVSANSGIGPIDFGNIDPSYSTLFAPFSTQRLFTPIGSNITDVTFFVPGTTTPATTSAFGAVFSDVDLIGTTLQFFDFLNNSLGTFAVPAIAGNETFSFLGVIFDSSIVNRVRITTGNAALGAGVTETAARDLVVMDDFLYAEPAVVPEPASLLLVGSGFIALAVRLRRRTRQ